MTMPHIYFGTVFHSTWEFKICRKWSGGV